MGFYFALMDQIAARAKELRRYENRWRAQEAKVLRVIDLCRVARHDDKGFLYPALEKTCRLLETNPHLQSPMIMDALDRAAKESGVPALRDTAALCYARMNWSVALADRGKNYDSLMSHDDWITDEWHKERHAACSKIEAVKPFLTGGDEAARRVAMDSIVGFAVDEVVGERLRALFAVSADPVSQHALQRIEEVQTQAVVTAARELTVSPVALRPCRN